MSTNIRCPKCNSQNYVKRYDIGRRTGSVIGSGAGAMSAVLTIIDAGCSIHPVAKCGSTALKVLSGCLSGASTGSNVGKQVDEQMLNYFTCTRCNIKFKV